MFFFLNLFINNKMDSDKIIDIITGNEFNIKELPLVVGSLSKYDKLNINNQFELEQFVGKTIGVNKEQLLLESQQTNYSININNIQSKLIISTCPIIYPYDFIINKDEEKNEYNLFSFGRACINGHPAKPFQMSHINSYDIISYNCLLCNHEHVFIFITKKLRKINNLQKSYGINNLNSLTSNYLNNNGENNNTINYAGDKDSYEDNKNGGMGDENDMKNGVEITFPNYPADEKIPLNWKAHEKDALKKNLLLYGYNRWNTIRVNSSNILNNKTDQELKAYSNSFIRCIIQISKDKKEITNFLSNLIQEKENEPWIIPNSNDWGDLIMQRASAWGKRIKYLYYIKNTIDIFKNLKANNKDKKKLLNNFNNYLSEEEKSNIKSKINPTFDNWCNLLWFLPNNLSFGQAPVSWWNKIHDIDLLRGTYKHGYASYANIKNDKKLCFSDQNNLSKDFPSADSITRRLKKIIQIIIKNWNNNNELMNLNENEKYYGINSIHKIKELNNDEKKSVFEFVIDNGLPRKINGEENYLLIYEKLKEKKIFNEIIEKEELNELVSGIKAFIINIKKKISKLLNNEENEEKNKNNILIEELDISIEKAHLFINNIHMFELIRKKIISKNYKLFNENMNNLIEVNNTSGIPEKCRDSNNWNVAINDKLLLYFIDEYGLSYLNTKINEMGVFQKCKLNYKEYISRVNYLYKFFEDIIRQNKLNEKNNNLIQNPQTTSSNIIKIKTSDFSSATDNYNNNIIENNSSNDQDQNNIYNNKSDNKLNIQRDEEGNIIYPIIISNSLKILNLGKIVYNNKNYHSEKNIFPIGYKSVREHQSMFNLQKRAEYICEILDGGVKPLYKITSTEDMEHPIIGDSSTFCWNYIGNAINELQGNKRKKVNINGDERFGLCDPKVVKLISTLPNAEKVNKQMIKFDDEDSKRKNK